MKKLYTLLVLALGIASCQTEPEGLDVVVGGEQDVMLNVSLLEDTRATSSTGFDFTNFEDNDKYDLRFILEISYNDTVVRNVKTSETTSTSFPIRLIAGRPYTFTVWADLVEEGKSTDLFYNTTNGLDKIEVIAEKWTPNIEARDAFTHTLTTEFTATTKNLTFELKRPFAKVCVVANDIADVRKFGIAPTAAVAEYTTSEMYTKFDAVAGAAKGETTVKTHTFNYADVDTYEDANSEQFTVFADYVFVPTDGNVQFSLSIYADAQRNDLIKTNNFNTTIPVVANKVTTIKGNVLTENGDVSITVGGELGVNETINYVDSASSLQKAINKAEDGKIANITLGGDIDLNDLHRAGTFSTRAGEAAGLVIPANKTVVIDLKGFTISQSKTQTAAYSMIENLGTLTIKDDSANKTGKISYADNGQGGNYVSNTIHNSGLLTIDGGIVENNSSATVASNGYPHPIDNSGTLVINGGTFTNNANYSSLRIWCTTDDDTIVTINGGTFNGSIDFQTPNASANKGTLTINRGTFNADTYTKCAVRLLGFGADVDEMNGYIRGGHFNGAIALKNWSGSELNSKVFDITAGTFTTAAKEGTDVALLNEDYTWVEAENGLWTLGLKPTVAKIGEVEYKSLQKAFNDVDNGTIVLVSDITLENTAVLAEGKTVILDLNGKTINSEDYAIYNYGTLTVTGEGVINGAIYGVSSKTIIENGTFNTRNDKDVLLNNMGELIINGGTVNGGKKGYPINSYYEGSKLVINNVKVNANFGCVQALSGESVEINGGTFEMTGVQGTTSHIAYFKDVDAVINGGTFKKIGDINMSAAGGGGICVNGSANLTINGGNFAGDYADVYSYGGAISIKGGTYKFEPQFIAVGYRATKNNSYWFEVERDPYYGYAKVASASELMNAIKKATADINIVFVNDIVGNVTLNNTKGKITINGDGKTYIGAMTLNSDVTFKNINFDGNGYNDYAITTRGTNYLTIEGCTAKNYGFGFVQLASGTVLTTVKNVTVSNMNYGVKVDYSNAVVIENANINVRVAAVLNSNYGEKPITIKNSKLNILGTWTRNNTIKTNYVFEGKNSIDTFKIDAAIDNFKLAAGASLTAPNEITVTTVDGYSVEYTDGKYISKQN